MKPLVFQLLSELSHERFVSGARLAEKFGVSRSTVSDALHEAGDAGVEIFSLTRRGYRLAEPIDLLSLELIRKELGTLARRLDISLVETIESTNTELAKRAGEGSPSGAGLVAEIQTAGRGRRGRVWQSAFGASLTFSLLWKFEKGASQLGGLSLAVGLAVMRGLRNLEIGVDVVQLKWPNDIVVGEEKLAGVLIESQGDMLGPTAVVIGIGVNVKLSARLQTAIDQPATDLQRLAGKIISRNQLLAEILRQLVVVLDEFQVKGFPAFKKEWIAAHALHGKPVRVHSAGGKAMDAVVRDVADDGSLIVAHRDTDLVIASGEVSLRAVRHG